ncbi:MAG: hypothetical protein B0A82_12780 [Alkalinema sp. CACIAM 70d]|nr:MAG: hypothetical protein B0A82_12780 [Alkalinema sp. CACIAM 70d]
MKWPLSLEILANPRWQWGLGSFIVSLLLIPMGWHNWGYFQRPDRASTTSSIAPGITYQRLFLNAAQPVVFHIARIDLQSGAIGVLVTPSLPGTGPQKTQARTTSAFLQEFQLQLAVNANFFYPFREEAPWDYFPKAGDRVITSGQAISNGHEYAPPVPDRQVICFDRHHRGQIPGTHTCPAGTWNAVAGNFLLLQSGYVLPMAYQDQQRYPRLLAALDRSGGTLWLILSDGKQPGYSQGSTLQESAEVAQRLGADTALNLDGGGSTTMVVAAFPTPRLLNAPIHNKIPMTERPVANHLGFFLRDQTRK